MTCKYSSSRQSILIFLGKYLAKTGQKVSAECAAQFHCNTLADPIRSYDSECACATVKPEYFRLIPAVANPPARRAIAVLPQQSAMSLSVINLHPFGQFAAGHNKMTAPAAYESFRRAFVVAHAASCFWNCRSRFSPATIRGQSARSLEAGYLPGSN